MTQILSGTTTSRTLGASIGVDCPSLMGGMSARWRGQVPDCSWDVLGVGRGNDPAVHSILVNRDERRWKAWISKRPNRDRQVFFHSLRLVVDGRSAAWTEVEFAMRAFVAHADVLRRGARERDVLASKPGLLPEDAASSALTGQAVANGDTHRLARNSSLELTTTAGGDTVGHVNSPRAPDALPVCRGRVAPAGGTGMLAETGPARHCRREMKGSSTGASCGASGSLAMRP